MGFDIPQSGSGGGTIMPYVKYDARSGRIKRPDRAQDSSGMYATTQVDITKTFKAVMDLENLETGWIKYEAAGAPAFLLTKLGQPRPPSPGQGWKFGVRVMLRLHDSCGGDVRELTGNAAAFVEGINTLHDHYVTGVAANPGKLPVVTLQDTQERISGGENKSTNYCPVFHIAGWTPRPADLVWEPKQATAPAAPVNAAPATGSRQVPPPAAKQPAMAGADDGGFG